MDSIALPCANGEQRQYVLGDIEAEEARDPQGSVDEGRREEKFGVVQER